MADNSKLSPQTLPIDKVKEMKERDFVQLLHEFWDYSLFHGNQMKIHTKPETNPHIAHTSSTALVPTPYSKLAYERTLAIQPIFNKLYHSVATDRDFLIQTLQGLADLDDFMKRYLDIYNKVHSEGISERIYLAINRSDYMCHLGSDVIKQVEFNTMASGAAGVVGRAALWHRYLTGTLLALDNSHIPEHTATSLLARGLIQAWQQYGNEQAAIVLIHNTDEFNLADQRSIQYELLKLNPRIPFMRVVFSTLPTSMTLDEDRRLFIHGKEVAVAYYRYGYSPKHYIDKEELWTVRYNIERSLAVKCPTIGYILAGTKKVQQTLCKPGVLEKYLDERSCALLRETFMAHHSFVKEEGGLETVELAKKNPQNYVMKPQREGGGNNTFGDDIPTKLEALSEDQLAAYTLMEKILPPTNQNYIVSGGEIPDLTEIISEMSIFGALVACDGNIVMNEGAGFLLRSKQRYKNEGDLGRGTSSLDSPWLL